MPGPSPITLYPISVPSSDWTLAVAKSLLHAPYVSVLNEQVSKVNSQSSCENPRVLADESYLNLFIGELGLNRASSVYLVLRQARSRSYQPTERWLRSRL